MTEPDASVASPDGNPITVQRLEVIVSSTTDGGHRLKTFGYLLDHVLRPSQRTLLDLGAGHCLFSMVAVSRGYLATAVDARTTRVPKRLGPIRFIQSDIRDFDPAGFGVIAIIGLLYHLEIADQLALLRRCAYGASVVVETQIHVPEMMAAAEAKPWHTIVQRNGYEGVDYPENDTPMASIGNPTSFWHTENSIIRLFAEAGYARVTLIDPIFRSVHGARRFYVLSAAIIPGSASPARPR